MEALIHIGLRIAVAVILGIVGSLIDSRKVRGFFLGLFLGPIGWLISFFLKKKRVTRVSEIEYSGTRATDSVSTDRDDA